MPGSENSTANEFFSRIIFGDTNYLFSYRLIKEQGSNNMHQKMTEIILKYFREIMTIFWSNFYYPV